MQGKKLTLDYLQNEIADLQRDYETVKQDLRVELDGPTKNRLQLRLTAIAEKIDAKGEEAIAIQQDLDQSAAQSARTMLTTILQRHDSHLNMMRTAYCRVLRQRLWQIPREPKTADDIIQELLRIPKGQSDHEAIAEFAANLVAVPQVDTELIAALQSWGEQYIGPSWAELLQQVAQAIIDQSPSELSSLLVQISRRDEASTQSDTEEYYQIQAWLIKDTQHYKEHQQGISLISIPGMTGDEIYALSTLSEDLPRLICQFYAEISHLLDGELDLHIFVPLELMNHAIDRWRLEDYGPPQPMGHQYKVVLRCTERISRSYRQKKLWQQKWTQYQILLGQLACDAFMTADDSDLDELFYDLDDADETVIGVQVVQAPSCVGANSLFGILLQVGMPLAIWSRVNLTQSTNKAELDRVLSACCLEQLPHTVKKERRRSRRQAEDAHVGHHLSLLWDDPHLIPPKSA